MTYSASAVAEPPSNMLEVPLRYRHVVSYGEKVKWLPPYRLIPSFASADGQSAVYRRRSQVVLTSDSEQEAAGAATSFALPDSEMKVRIDQYGYARLIRPTRSTQHVDPLSNLVDGAADMEREAALAVCQHLNEHVEAMAYPQRWTPSPDLQLVPLSGASVRRACARGAEADREEGRQARLQPARDERLPRRSRQVAARAASRGSRHSANCRNTASAQRRAIRKRCASICSPA